MLERFDAEKFNLDGPATDDDINQIVNFTEVVTTNCPISYQAQCTYYAGEYCLILATEEKENPTTKERATDVSVSIGTPKGVICDLTLQADGQVYLLAPINGGIVDADEIETAIDTLCEDTVKYVSKAELSMFDYMRTFSHQPTGEVLDWRQNPIIHEGRTAQEVLASITKNHPELVIGERLRRWPTRDGGHVAFSAQDYKGFLPEDRLLTPRIQIFHMDDEDEILQALTVTQGGDIYYDPPIFEVIDEIRELGERYSGVTVELNIDEEEDEEFTHQNALGYIRQLYIVAQTLRTMN